MPRPGLSELVSLVYHICRLLSLLSAINILPLWRPVVVADVGYLLLYVAVVSSTAADVGWAIAADVGYY
jgi:hypothetical protein